MSEIIISSVGNKLYDAKVFKEEKIMLEKKIITDELTEAQKTIRVIGQGCKDDCDEEKRDWIGRTPTQFTICYVDHYRVYGSVPGCKYTSSWLCPWT